LVHNVVGKAIFPRLFCLFEKSILEPK
jgi:hypothetical protein